MMKAIVITGAEGKFSGGFDISAFGQIQNKTIHPPKLGFISLDILSDVVAAAKKPFVTAVDGLALGGGLEVAMSSIISGTQALPRLVGIAKALEMILTSKPVKGEEALSLGLVDALASSDELLDIVRCWALSILELKRPWVISYCKTDKLEPLGEAREILKFVRARTRKQAPNLTHPLVCIDVIEEGVVSGARTGLWKEAEAFQVLLESDTCKSLVHIFFAQRGTTKVPGVTDLGLKPWRIKKVASNTSTIDLNLIGEKNKVSGSHYQSSFFQPGSCDATFRNCSHSEDISLSKL